MTEGQAWIVRLTNAAAADQAAIVTWTTEQFGAAQARVYGESLSAALIALRAGPSIPGVKQRDEVAEGLLTLHIARDRRRGRHFVLFRARGDERWPIIEVLRILHDAMDLERHVSGTN